MLKDMGRVKPRKSHRIRTCKCQGCGNKIDIDERIELKDYDLVGREEYVFHCPKCGTETDIIKL